MSFDLCRIFGKKLAVPTANRENRTDESGYMRMNISDNEERKRSSLCKMAGFLLYESQRFRKSQLQEKPVANGNKDFGSVGSEMGGRQK